MMSDSTKPWAGAAIYGSVGENFEWKAVMDHYLWDRLSEAYAQALTLGAGNAAFGLRTFRQVEAEYRTREASERHPLTEWLEIEIPTGGLEFSQDLADAVIATCDDSARRLGWTHGPKVLLSVLTAESDAPWVDGRFGYMVDKYPFDKICIPVSAFSNASRLHEVVAHEYAHVIALNLSQGHISRWMQELIAVMMQSPTVDADSEIFLDPDIPWLTPVSLEGAFSSTPFAVRNAYAQSAVLGHYLVVNYGEEKLGELLRALGNNSSWTEFKMALSGQSHDDEALREVFGFGERTLFERANPK